MSAKKAELEEALPDGYKEISQESIAPSLIEEKILCLHCMRTAKNGVRCMGICVEESGY